MGMPKLFSTPIKQEAWYKQIREEITISKRPIDKMSVAEINKMYEEGKFLCDTCSKELFGFKKSLTDHVLHLINPAILWSCEDCFQSDLRNHRIIAMADEPAPYKWQDQNK
jgi:hypothetical protein